MTTLNRRAEDYELTRWAVVKFQGQLLPAWAVCGPGDGHDSEALDQEFATFEEAINYATEQAVIDA